MMKTLGVVSAVLIAALCLGCGSQSNEAAQQLLDDYMVLVTDVQGTAASKTTVLDELSQRAETHSDQGRLPSDFYRRYQDMIDATRLSIAPGNDEDAREDARVKLTKYIESITGAPPPTEINLTVSAAFAISEEAVRLSMLLSGETDPEKARQKYAERLTARKNKQ
jgi:hypothetical protein